MSLKIILINLGSGKVWLKQSPLFLSINVPVYALSIYPKAQSSVLAAVSQLQADGPAIVKQLCFCGKGTPCSFPQF